MFTATVELSENAILVLYYSTLEIDCQGLFTMSNIWKALFAFSC
ncbi:hypothetical protein [Ruminococcus sp.]